ncbi:hypothetical protein KBD61_04320 [Patescibacteria group bacterium]|nr:hypothetical protein [Patescibacteria group bacterium]MBP9710219.1 hypothetical protein [Patescibacteria group bacterium]
MSKEERSLLWLDDDAWTLHGHQRALSNVGFDVEFCATVDEAVARFKNGVYDLVIWDNVIPSGRDIDLPPPHHRDEGVYGGVAFYEWVLVTKPEQTTVLYTDMRSVVPDYSRPDRRQYAFWKGEHDPGSFAEVMLDLLL